MDSDASGWLWLVIDVAMVAALGIALIYATLLWRRRRSGAAEHAGERGSARLYEREAEREQRAEGRACAPLMPPGVRGGAWRRTG